jgi:hypothetical protein
LQGQTISSDKLQKAADKAEDNLLKSAAKAACAMIKTSQAPPVPCFIWSKEASLELLDFYHMVKDKHNKLKSKKPGFVAFNKFFSAHKVNNNIFPLLDGRSSKCLIARYCSLMGSWCVSNQFSDIFTSHDVAYFNIWDLISRTLRTRWTNQDVAGVCLLPWWMLDYWFH